MIEVTGGNAAVDQGPFRGWLIGDLETWCQENAITFDAERYRLRDSRAVAVKWGIHRQGDLRPGGWSVSCDCTTLSLLLRGNFTLIFRDAQDPTRNIEYRLQEEGDYLLWGNQVEHTWRAEQDSVILTVRWPA